MGPPASRHRSAIRGTHLAAAQRLLRGEFLIVGIKAPFWPVWLAGRGLGAREIAVLFAAAIWVNVATTPASARSPTGSAGAAR